MSNSPSWRRTGKAQSRLTIYAPQGGTVVEKLAVEGNYVKAGDPIYRIAELSTVWLMLKLFPEDATRIRFGQRVEAIVQSLPGETLRRPRRLHRSHGRSEDANRRSARRTAQRRRTTATGRLCRSANHVCPSVPKERCSTRTWPASGSVPMHPQIIRDEPGQCPICGMDLVPTSQYGFAERAGSAARVAVCAAVGRAAGRRE